MVWYTYGIFSNVMQCSRFIFICMLFTINLAFLLAFLLVFVMDLAVKFILYAYTFCAFQVCLFSDAPSVNTYMKSLGG